MNEKLDLVKILKDCPKGIELYSPIYGLGILTKVTNRIHVKFPKEHNVKCFRPDGKVSEEGEIMLFPKGKTAWEGFQKPFVDGDVVYAKVDGTPYIIIYQKQIDERVYRHACLCLETDMFGCDKDCIFTDEPIDEWRLATEEEKAKLFQVIKDKGYQWNPETKTLEKLIEPKFKVGDSVISKSGLTCKITDITSEHYLLRIGLTGTGLISIKYQDDYILVQKEKFDPKTLQPFDKVLMTDSLSIPWTTGFFSYIRESEEYRFAVGATHWRYCIPYNNNTKHLIGKTDEAPKFYRYWEK